MSEPIRILIVEDLPTDADLAMREIRKPLADCEFQRVEIEPAFLEALEKFKPDLILSDYHLPRFNGMQALKLALERVPLTPVIIFTGSLNEDVAVECIKAGATDYIIKENIKRLGTAVMHALEEKKVRLERKQAEEKLRESEEQYRSLFEHMAEGYAYCQMIYENGQAQDWIYISVNEAFEKLTGLKDVTGKWVSEVIPGIRKTDPKLFEIYSRVALTGQPEKFEMFVEVLQMWFSISVYSPGKEFFVAVFDVITERKVAEEKLRASEETYRYLFANHPHSMWIYDLETLAFLEVNEAAVAKYGYSRANFLRMTIKDIRPLEELPLLMENLAQPRQVMEYSEGWHHRLTDGRVIDVSITSHALQFNGHEAALVIAQDITEQKRAEEAVFESERQMRALVTSLDDIVFELDEQGTYLNVWTADENLLVQPQAELLGRNLVEVMGQENGRPLAEAVKRAVTSGSHESIEYPLQVMGGQRWFLARISPILTQDDSHRTASILVRDISERKQNEMQIQIQLQRMSALNEIDRAISSSLDMRLSLDILLSEALSQLGVDAASVLLLNPLSQTLEYLVGKGFRTPSVRQARMHLGEGLAGQVGLSRKVLHIPDLMAAGSQFKRAGLLKNDKFVAYFGVPLIAKGTLKGVLEIFHRSVLDPDLEWVNYLETLGGQAAIAIDNVQLFEGLQQSNMDLSTAYDATIAGWSRAMDLRDKETEGHTLRVTELTLKLSEKMGISQQELVHIRRGALLHDIGKLGVPDLILLKPGPLSEEEWGIMRQHPAYALDMLLPIAYLQPALDIPYCHHEKWDGTGYPRKLSGEQIPIAARLFAVVDVWDALRSDRPYRGSWSVQKAREYILEQTGKHFDPRLVDIFLGMIENEDGLA